MPIIGQLTRLQYLEEWAVTAVTAPLTPSTENDSVKRQARAAGVVRKGAAGGAD